MTMRMGIVASSTLAKHNRWDPAYFLGDTRHAAAVEAAERNLKQAKLRLLLAQCALANEQYRLQQFIMDGTVPPHG
jgi:hypothetical protein